MRELKYSVGVVAELVIFVLVMLGVVGVGWRQSSNYGQIKKFINLIT